MVGGDGKDVLNLFFAAQSRKLEEEEIVWLNQLIDCYPHYPLLHYIVAKGSHLDEDVFKASVYAPNRGLLYNYIKGVDQDQYIQWTEMMESPGSKITAGQSEDRMFSIVQFESEGDSERESLHLQHLSEEKNLFSIGTSQVTDYNNTFLDWSIKVSTSRLLPLVRKVDTDLEISLRQSQKQFEKESLRESNVEDAQKRVAKFLESQQHFRPTKLPEGLDPSDTGVLESVEEDAEIVSETLAQLHASQGNIEEAKRIYKKLSLLFPSKNAYFDAQIQKLIR